MHELITELHVAGLDGIEIEVESFRGVERMSDLYQLELTVLVDRDAPFEQHALEREAWLSLRRGEQQRVFHGVLADVELRGFRMVQERELLECGVTLVPRAWLLSQRRTSRIFQNLRVDEVIQAVLAPYFIPSRWVLDQRYPARAYCTQFEETDLELVKRLAAEAGIYFFFENPVESGERTGASAAGPREVMVFADNELAYPPMNQGRGSDWSTLAAQVAGASTPLASAAAPALHVRGDTGALAFEDEYGITGFRSRRQVASRRFAFREYDPDRPQANLSSTVNERPPSVKEGEDSPELQLERYEHHASFLFPDWEFELNESRRMARAHRRSADVASSESTCPWLEPGRRFRLEDHELSRLNQEYVLVAVSHELRAPEDGRTGSYRNRFEAVPATVAYVPERPEPRRQHVCLTATVQAADATAIHTDSGAHVRVKFHWDRGQHGQRFNTCWIRVMQPWAGPGFGTLFLPREGSEVVVTFEGGDPDRPLILGSVYNAATPPPAALPASKTRSGIRSASTPGGNGANELWFEDAAGNEQIVLHAQRDMLLEVLHDRDTRVRNDDHVRVGGRRRERVDGRAELELGREREVRVGENDTLRVEGNRLVTVAGRDDHGVTSDRTATLGGSDRLEVNGAREVIVRGDSVARHAGNVTQIIGGPESPRSAVTHVEGSQLLTATRRIEISADEHIVLRCGDSVLRLGPDKVEITSPTLVLAGDGARLRLMSGTARIHADDRISGVSEEILLESSGAALGLSSEAALDGSKVLLNSPAAAEDTIEDDPVQTTTIELLDDEGNPIANQPYRIVLGDGSEVAGVLDEEGRAEIELDEDGDIYFPGVSDVEGS
jgi:type VI secretion system secreted protein VgrG